MSVKKQTQGKLSGLEHKYFCFSFDKLNSMEIGIVHKMTRSTRHKKVLQLNLFINHLGNGWMYPIIAFAILGWYGLGAWSVIMISTLSAVVAHLMYPKIKNYLKRKRPHVFDPQLIIPVEPLDKYSCPSGHCMTLVAVAIPLWTMFPELGLIIIAGWIIIAWSRLSLGHHYFSDIMLGSIFGAMISIPNTWFLF